jgi:hypothetical protein
MTPTTARTLANRLALDQPNRALVVARAIESPWFRCQALAQVGRYWPDEKYGSIVKEAVIAADMQDEVYRQVAVSAWPIRCYLERRNVEPARKLLLKYTRASSSIVNMGSRSEALLLLFQAARPFDSDLWRPVFRALIAAGEPSLSWRQGRAISHAAEMVISDDRQLVEEAVRTLSEQKHLSALRALLKGGTPQQTPRPFFWIEKAQE